MSLLVLLAGVASQFATDSFSEAYADAVHISDDNADNGEDNILLDFLGDAFVVLLEAFLDTILDIVSDTVSDLLGTVLDTVWDAVGWRILLVGISVLVVGALFLFFFYDDHHASTTQSATSGPHDDGSGAPRIDASCGSWSGTFSQLLDGKWHTAEFYVELTFRDDNGVTGHGSDARGKFIVRGERHHNRVTFVKDYSVAGANQSLLTGDTDPNPSYVGNLEARPSLMMRGTFEIAHHRTGVILGGNFVLWPTSPTEE